MKYIKTYENNTTQTKVEVGEYVICTNKVSKTSKDLDDFLDENIGVVKSNNFIPEFPYLVQFEYIPYDVKLSYEESHNNNCIVFNIKEIEYHSKNKEDLEIYIDTNNYNL